MVQLWVNLPAAHKAASYPHSGSSPGGGFCGMMVHFEGWLGTGVLRPKRGEPWLLAPPYLVFSTSRRSSFVRCGMFGERGDGKISMHSSCTSLRTSALALCFFMPMHGQTANTGAIADSVSDRSGGLVAGAAVAIVSEATREERTLTNDGQGSFSTPFLTPGSY